LEIKEWNKIHDVFIDKFGWEVGTRLLIRTSKEYSGGKSVYEWNAWEDRAIIRALRKTYEKESKWLEKERVK
tara:strand:- start:2555 stop:2770 length:216 start_codon:yes stop_codon:yes gene_type:complete